MKRFLDWFERQGAWDLAFLCTLLSVAFLGILASVAEVIHLLVGGSCGCN